LAREVDFFRRNDYVSEERGKSISPFEQPYRLTGPCLGAGDWRGALPIPANFIRSETYMDVDVLFTVEEEFINVHFLICPGEITPAV
jgi:hypothetical protein